MPSSPDTLKRDAALWFVVVRLVALSCVGIHVLMLVLRADAVGVIMAVVSVASSERCKRLNEVGAAG